MILFKALAIGAVLQTAHAYTPLIPDTLDGRMKRAGKLYYGSATDAELTDPTMTEYAQILGSEFGCLVPANAGKFLFTEPEQNVFNYTDFDSLIQFAHENRQLVRGHNLVWHQEIPNWVLDGHFSSQQLVQIMLNHIHNVAGHFAGKLIMWDVVNEALNDDAEGSFRETIWYNATNGPEYIYEAFLAARLADPYAKLFYNDYNIESPGGKANATYNLIKTMKQKHIPIDGVGLECHFIASESPTVEQIQETMERYVSLDVDVTVTELDVRVETPESAADTALQAQVYANVIQACLNVPRCLGVNVWDFTDSESWVPSTFPGQGAACQWDDDYNKKEAYYSVYDLLGNLTYSPVSLKTGLNFGLWPSS